MALIPLYEAKTYLRVDSSDEDVWSASSYLLLSSSVWRWQGSPRSSGKPLMPLPVMRRGTSCRPIQTCIPGKNWSVSATSCVWAILYALGYLYEHREEADHHSLTLTLRSLLFSIREGVV